MTLFQAAVLGIIQGLTEFLPVSSTAHLVIAQNFFSFRGGESILLIFDIVVHLGTLLSLLVYFAWEFFRQKRGQVQQVLGEVPVPFSVRLFWLVILATIPTAVIGLLLKEWMEANFNSLMITVWTLLVNSLILWSTKWIREGNRKEMKNWLDAIWIGIAQGVSILPGISRSGATCATALWLKIRAGEAARFSFLIAIPAILGATVVVIPESVHHFSGDMWPALMTGFVSAFVSGYLAIVILFKVMLRGHFHWFGVYTALLAIVTFVFAGVW